MAYDPTTGEWKDEEVDVESRINRLTNTNSDYMKSAEAPALQAAHSRGLLNSTMAVQSGQAARLAAALPIASQDASQANQRAMQGRQLQSTDVTQRRGLASQEALTREGYQLQRELQTGDIASRERMQGRDIAANRANLELELGSRDRLQAAEAAAEKERLGMQLTTQERLALQELQAAERRLGISIASEERMQQAGFGQQLTVQQRENANRQWLAQFDAATQEKLQGLDLASRERMQQAGFTQEQALQASEQAQQQWLAQFDAQTRQTLQSLDNATRLQMQQLDITSQQRIADLNVAAGERADATRAAIAFEATYAGMLEAIMSNPDIPAEARQTYMDRAAAMRDSNYSLIEQMYGIDLDWAA